MGPPVKLCAPTSARLVPACSAAVPPWLFRIDKLKVMATFLIVFTHLILDFINYDGLIFMSIAAGLKDIKESGGTQTTAPQIPTL